MSQLDGKQNELEEIRKYKIQGSFLRSKAKWYLEGEKSNKFFLNLEKHNYSDKTISRLKINDDSEEITDMKEILKEQKKYFEKLYAPSTTVLSEESENYFFPQVNNSLEKLNDQEKDSCEGKITERECLSVLKEMPNSKSPGSDGFTSEFFKFFWKDIKVFLVRSINCGYDKGLLSTTQRQAIIQCIPKEDKSRLYLDNWRPISLLNIDYKIASGVIAQRIKTHLPKLISTTQKGYMSGRYIGECTRQLLDIINNANEEKKTGLVLSLDFQKAFDSVDWKYIEKVLKYFNFGPSICNWIKTFYNNISSAVTNYGYISEFFRVFRGVRQGDPLSPYLFILCVEILSAGIKNDQEIKGLVLCETENIISQYADDGQIYLEDDENSLKKLLRTLEIFGSISGLRLNKRKSKIFWVGTKLGSNETLLPDENLCWINSGLIKILGINVNLDDINDHESVNFIPKIKKVKKSLYHWSHRGLSLFGKITVVKCLGISQFVHLFSILGVTDKLIKEIEKMFIDFIWDEKTPQISKETLIKDYSDGGLRLTHIPSFVTSLKLSWVQRVFDCKNFSPWKIMFMKEIQPFGGDAIFCLNGSSLAKIAVKIKNSFWANILKSWASLDIPTDGLEHILTQPICFNDKIMNGKELIFRPKLIKSGIVLLHQLFNPNNGEKIPENELKNYDESINFLNYNSLFCAIPKEWKEILVNNAPFSVRNLRDNFVVKFKKASKPTKYLYSFLMSKAGNTQNNSEINWKKKEWFNREVPWERYYEIPHICTVEADLKSFQYKILHKALYTNSKLVKAKIIPGPIRCTFCDIDTENIEHLFYFCPKARTLYLQLFDYVNDKTNLDTSVFKLCPFSVLFGFLNDVEYINAINHLILLTKRFIYICRCKNIVDPNFQNLLNFIKFKIKLEKMSIKSEIFQAKWGMLGGIFEIN